MQRTETYTDVKEKDVEMLQALLEAGGAVVTAQKSVSGTWIVIGTFPKTPDTT
jgi:hypothetical protein